MRDVEPCDVTARGIEWTRFASQLLKGTLTVVFAIDEEGVGAELHV